MAKDANGFTELFKEIEWPADPPPRHPLVEAISTEITPKDPPLSPVMQELSKPVIPGADQDE